MYTIKSANTIIKSGNTIITSGRVLMEPPGNSYTKQCFIRTPHLFKDKPIVSVTVYTPTGKTIEHKDSRGPNDAFPVFGIEETKANGETIFKVSATNNEIRKDSDAEYWCDFMMMGELK